MGGIEMIPHFIIRTSLHINFGFNIQLPENPKEYSVKERKVHEIIERTACL